MNGQLIVKTMATIAAAGIIAAVAFLWSVSSRLAIIDDRLTGLMTRSDRNDAQMDRRLQNIEQQLKH